MKTLSVRTEALNLIDLREENSAKLVHMTKAEQYLLFILYEILLIPWVSALPGPSLDSCSGGFVADTGHAQKASSDCVLLRSLTKALTGLVSTWCSKAQTSWTTHTTTSFSKYNANFSNDEFSAAISS